MNLNHIAKKPFLDAFYSKPYMPHLLRAALHDATTAFSSGHKGPTGVLRLQTELEKSNSAQMRNAVKMVKEIQAKGNHITTLLSFSDLLQLGAYTAVEYCGGPTMHFRMGRLDTDHVEDHGNALAVTGNHENAVMVQQFGGMGLSAEEYVALMGSYTIGFANDDNRSKKGRWTMNPFVFDNTYFQEVLLGHESNYLKTEADLKLLSDPALRTWVEEYANDNNLFFENYAKAHVKVSEMGQEEHLLSEFNEADIIHGGY
jgi:L-ascorbate peroxidase